MLHADDFGRWADLGCRAAARCCKESQFFGKLPPRLAQRSSRRSASASSPPRWRLPAPTPPPRLRSTRSCRRRCIACTPRVRLKLLQVFQRSPGRRLPTRWRRSCPSSARWCATFRREHRLAALDLALRGRARASRAAAWRCCGRCRWPTRTRAHPAVEQWVRRGLEIAARQRRRRHRVLCARIAHQRQGAAGHVDGGGAQRCPGPAAQVRADAQWAHGLDSCRRRVRLRPPLEEFPLEDEVALPLKVDLFGDARRQRAPLPFPRRAAGRPARVRYLRRRAARRRRRRPRSLSCGRRSIPSCSKSCSWLRRASALRRRCRARIRAWRASSASWRPRCCRGSSRNQVPSQSTLLDLLLVWLLSGRDAAGLPVWLRPLAALVAPCVAPLANRDATVNDSLAVAQLLVGQLVEPGEQRGRGRGRHGLRDDHRRDDVRSVQRRRLAARCRVTRRRCRPRQRTRRRRYTPRGHEVRAQRRESTTPTA